MRKVVLLLVTVLALNLSSAQKSELGWMFVNSNTIELDKQLHFVAGGGVAMAGYFVAYGTNGQRRSNAKLWGILSATVIGTIKEMADADARRKGNGGNGFDAEDLAYTVAGGIVATYTFDFLVVRAKRRSIKRREKAKALYND